MLEKRRRTLGRDNYDTFVTFGNLAASLSGQGKHAEAVEIGRDELVSTTRLLGAEHKSTLTAASNLAFRLWRFDLKTEAEELFLEKLALSRRALGATHEVTQNLLQGLRAHGFAA